MAEVSAGGSLLAYTLVGVDGPRIRYDAQAGPVYNTFDPQGDTLQRLTPPLPPPATPNLYGEDYAPSVLDTAVYDAFGAARADLDAGTGTPEQQPPMGLGFGGQYGYYTDPETGLSLLTHRYYDAGRDHAELHPHQRKTVKDASHHS